MNWSKLRDYLVFTKDNADEQRHRADMLLSGITGIEPPERFRSVFLVDQNVKITTNLYLGTQPYNMLVNLGKVYEEDKITKIKVLKDMNPITCVNPKTSTQLRSIRLQ